MVACLERTDGNAEFHQIVDFLTSSMIYYALTVSPTIYASYIEQFWATAKSKTVNDVKQIHAKVDGKTVVGNEVVYTGEDDRVVKAATIAASLEAEQESGNINKTQSMATLNEPSPQGTSSEVNKSRSGGDSMEHQDDLMNFIPPTPYDSPLSGGHTPESDEGRPNINELMNICTQLSNRVLALKQFKTAQDFVIKRLKTKVKRLEKRQRERTPGMKLFKIGTSKKKTLDKENDVNATEPVSTTGDAINTASVIPDVSVVGLSTSTAGDIFEDEMTTMADTLMAIRSTRPRTTSVVIHNVEEEPRRVTPLPTVKAKTKNKHSLRESKGLLKKKAAEQETKDAGLIKQMEDVQARMDADELLTERLQQKEREQFTVDEQARMLVDLIAERKRFFVAQRTEQIRNKPPTRAQLRNKMEISSYTENALKDVE
nr:hypothetical protein [Tanacetum cinerariifolium]